MKWFSKYPLPDPKINALLILLFVYFLCRLFFQQLVVAKTAFIFPTGVLVGWFYGGGEYINREWLFGINETRFILGETCSGTTFFSLLVAYIVYRIKAHASSCIWLIWAYPIAIAANAMRVLSSIYAHNILTIFNTQAITDEVHVVTGATAFLFCFLLVAYFIEAADARSEHEH
ncbi:MAG: hypothetical protein GY785_13140 [Gammaproteobacteria bacterium]|nr:hypothetical protein [Gammaproteobacteria bacterium]